jgi:hypothetical protein
MPAIPATEIADLLRAVARGERVAQLADRNFSWDGVYAGDVAFKISGYRIVIFNDCDEVDYVDSAVSPDRRMSDSDDWMAAGGDPIDLLEQEEREALLRVLKKIA